MRSLGMIDLPRPLTEQEEIENLAYRLYEDEGKPRAEPKNTGPKRRRLFAPNDWPSPNIRKSQPTNAALNSL